jgi:hypothetical protein
VVSKLFVVSKFANWALSAKSAKYTPLASNPLYGTLPSRPALQSAIVMLDTIQKFAIAFLKQVYHLHDHSL